VSGDGSTPATVTRLVSTPIVPRMAVRWRDLDHLGHVNSVVFLTYLDEGRTAWLSAVLGPTFQPEQYVVAHVDLDYRAEIPAGTTMIETHHTIESIGRSSITFREELRIVGGETVADGGVVIVMWEPSTHRSRPLTERERAALNAVAR
jgi:acyl-CoA thioester hydrolase